MVFGPGSLVFGPNRTPEIQMTRLRPKTKDQRPYEAMSKPVLDDFSRSFYPFLHQERSRPKELVEELTFSLLEKVRESVDVKTKFFEENKEAIIAASLDLAKAFHRGHKLLVCGNGGSATDAQHVAVEFMHPITVGRKALPRFVCQTTWRWLLR